MGFLQSASNTVTSGSTIAATFGSSTAGGASIIVLVSNQSGRTVSSIALSGSSDTFTKAVSALESTFGEDAEIWIDASDTSGHTTVTVTFSGTVTAAEIDIIEWSGISSGTPDKTHTGSSASAVTSWSSGSTGTLTQAAEVAFGVVAVNDEFATATTLTGPSSPWTNLAQLNASAGLAQLAGYQQVNATTALTYNGTSTQSVAYAACIATFKLTAAAAAAVTTTAVTARARQARRAAVAVAHPVPAQPGHPAGRSPAAAPRAVRGRAATAAGGPAPVMPTRAVVVIRPPRPRLVQRRPPFAWQAGPAVPPPAIPPAIPGSGGDRTSALWEMLHTGRWRPPAGYGAVDPGQVPSSGSVLPRPSGRGLVLPPEPVNPRGGAPAAPPEPPPDPLAPVRESLSEAGAGLFELGRALSAPLPPPRPKDERCGARKKIGMAVLVCTRKYPHAGMHSDGRVWWR